MPRPALLLGTGLTPAGDYPYSITIGGVEVAPSKAELQSITFQDNGDDEPGRLTLRVWDSDNGLSLPDEGVILVQENSSDQQVWMGTVQRKSYDPTAVGRFINIEGVSISTLLDETLIVRETRPVESDRARVLYLWGKYARWPLSTDMQYVTETNAALPVDDILGMTLRSALKFTMGLAGSTNRMSIDMHGRLHWFAGSETNPAPYNINVALAPGGGNIAPDRLTVERDGTIKNRAYVRGRNDAGSGWFQDDASVAAYGARETFIDAPSADTAAKAQSIARLYFGRIAQPRTRGTFQTEEPYNGWRAGQNVTITDAANDLSAESFRLARVTTTFTKGTGTKRYTAEFGGVRPRASDVEADLLGRTLLPGQAVAGDTFDDDGNLLISSGTSGATGGFGPAVRRYITSGVYNGDFALPPPFPDSVVNEAWNPLPFWTFVQAGGVAITAQSVEDSDSGSGRVIEFTMSGQGGDAADDSYFEQIIPINASRSQAWAYVVRFATDGGSASSNAKIYRRVAWLASDGVTVIGTEGAKEAATTGAAGPFDVSVTPGAADGFTGGQVPSNAYYMRVRVGLRRDTEATTTALTVSLYEVYVSVGPAELMLQDVATPTNQPARLIKNSGTLLLLSHGVSAAGVSQAPNIQMAVAANRISFSDSLYRIGGTSFPASPTTNVLFYRTDLQMWFTYDGTRWVCTCPHVASLTSQTALSPISATTTEYQMVALPVSVGLDIYVEEFDCFFKVDSGGTALSGSHSWAGAIRKWPTNLLLTTLTIDSGSSGVYRNVNLNAAADEIAVASDFGITVTWTKTGTPGNLRAAVAATYRFIGS